jgi:hypothetical protein
MKAEYRSTMQSPITIAIVEDDPLITQFLNAVVQVLARKA